MPRRAVVLPFAVACALAARDAAPQGMAPEVETSSSSVAIPPPAPATPVDPVTEPETEEPAAADADDSVPWARALPAIDVVNVNTLAEGSVRLYRDDGAIDDVAIDAFDQIASGGSESSLDRRLIQLVFKAAYHFHAGTVASISAWRPSRKGKGNKHSAGEAIDFRLPGFRAAALASYLRTLPRAGVGIYTHPRTQYVHLDVRDESYHWVDGSPPGVTWREQGIPDWGRTPRDASWTPARDLPIDP